ncbi:hypothetical protein [Leifsonia sp. SIMBA_070]|uniref:hypothetical protein n=1 Tax=Leifsonia sp. SIMBA_070 TaxID=3085810 RepID=UPI00397ABA55
MPPADLVRACPSRSNGRRCTKPLGHAGLHRNQGAMWTDAGADPLHCPGSGEAAEPAPALPDGFPGGRALCPHCLRFVQLDTKGALLPHDTVDADETEDDVLRAREWFNTHGWNEG